MLMRRMALGGLVGARRQHGVDQVHPEHSQGLLLLLGCRVEHPHVDHDRRRRFPGLGLELDAEPAVALVVAAEGARDDGVGKGEEGRVLAALLAEVEGAGEVLVLEHGLDALAGDVPV